MSKGGVSRTEDDDLLEETFNFFDKDGGGYITVDEYGQVVRALGLNPSDEEIRNVVKTFDLNHDGRIHLDEFKQIWPVFKEKHMNDGDDIRNAFKMFDKNNDGFIEAKELRVILHKFGEALSKEQIDDMINIADVDDDGKINYEEFVKYMMAK